MKRSPLLLHTFFIALYPPLFFFVHNLGEANFYDGVRPLILSLLVAILLLVGLHWITKNWQRAGLMASIFLAAFFFYSNVNTLFGRFSVFGFRLSSKVFYLPFWILLALILLWWAGWKLKETQGITQILNLVGGVLLLGIAVQAAQTLPQTIQTESTQSESTLHELGLATITQDLHPPEKLPDIYYIILDAYSRADVLQSEFDYDNTAFIDALKQRGFYVAACSRSNYPKTAFSLSTSMDMQYFLPFGQKWLQTSNDVKQLAPYLRNTVLSGTLKELGYKTVALDTGHAWVSISNADVFYIYHQKITLEDFFPPELTDFEQSFLGDTTLLGGLTPVRNWIMKRDLIPGIASNDSFGQGTASRRAAKLKYDLMKNDLDKLEYDIPLLPGPKYVFAHLLTVHPPFVFTQDGSFQHDDTPAGYRQSIAYTNARILQAIDAILAHSAKPPIIILQGDHAHPQAKASEAILNAYYLPNGGGKMLYPTISPVNSFRVVFDAYFGAKLELLEDQSYTLGEQPNGLYRFDLAGPDTCMP